MIKVAFLGLPNVGKSSLINSMSNSLLKTGNWPGVTVEKKEVFLKIKDKDFHFIDLPGTYGLQSDKIEEAIPLNFLLTEKIDAVVNVIDSTNLVKNLSLTLQLKEFGLPMVLAFNFADEFKKFKFNINKEKLESLLNEKLVFTSSKSKAGIDEMLSFLYQITAEKDKTYKDYKDFMHHNELKKVDINSSTKQDLEENKISNIREIQDASNSFFKKQNLSKNFHLDIENKLNLSIFDSEILSTLQNLKNQAEFVSDKYKDALSMFCLESLSSSWFINLKGFEKNKQLIYKVKNQKKAFIEKLLKECEYNFLKEKQLDITKKIDKVFLNKFLSPVFAFIILTGCFAITFSIANPFIDLIDGFFNLFLAKYIGLMISGLPNIIQSFLIDGLLSAFGLTISFIPLIFLLNFFLSLLQESGYIPRVAFTFEKMFGLFGISGRAIFPLLLGFGCNVPTIYSLKSLKNENERLSSVFLSGFISCGARLPIFGLFSAAFFPNNTFLTIVAMYATGFVFALLVGSILKFKFKNEKNNNIIEMPLYRIPSFKNILKVSIIKTGAYTKRVFLIVKVVFVIWILASFPKSGEDSIIGKTAKFVQPVFMPLGFGDRWEVIASLPSSVIAKEGAIATIATFLSNEKEENQDYDMLADFVSLLKSFRDDLYYNITKNLFDFIEIDSQKLKSDYGGGIIRDISKLWTDKYSPLKAISFMIFILLTVPCIVVLNAIKNEFSKKLMVYAILSYFGTSYFAALIFYQGALFITNFI